MKKDIAYVYDKLKQLRFEFKESDRKLFPNEYTFDYGLDRYIRKDGNDLYIAKDTFKPLEEELEYADKCHNLEEEIGCSLEVVFNALKQDYVYTSVGKRGKLAIGFYGDFLALFYGKYEMLRVSNYKKTWWLKENREE